MTDLTIVKDGGAGPPHLRGMTHRLTRRRFLLIGTAGCLAAGGARGHGTLEWRGIAFGADAAIVLPDRPGTAATLAAVAAEIGRLENVFSLFRPGSQLCRLNAEGKIDDPAPDLVAVLYLAAKVHAATEGAFDPTIQPLWTGHADAAARGRTLDDHEIDRLRLRCGWEQVDLRPNRIVFARAGMALTLNGIAQGFAADRIAGLLRGHGFHDALVDAGEVVALGRRPDGGLWKAAAATPQGVVLRRCALSDRALATSAPLGTVLDPAGRLGHILDPRTGRPAGRWRTVSVSAPGAALADALSTAFCVMESQQIGAAAARFPGVAIEALDT